jgi:DNA-binding FadR family transcriptional regulator
MTMIDEDLSPNNAKRAASNVIRSLERQIVSGELADGAHLPSERELMEIYGVSRTVVREAVTTLASRGLLEARPRYRPIARRPGYDTALKAVEGAIGHLLTEPDGIKNLFNSRIFLEMALVRHAALHAKRADIQALKEALDANEAAIGQSELFYATDVAFHGTLFQIPKNPVFPVMHMAYVAWLSPHWRKMPRMPERNETNFLRHLEIFTAIQNRDPEAAEEAMQAHLVSAWEFVRGTFR